MKVDADYTPKPYEEWSKADWPRTYQTPKYKNIFAIGIAFAPPHLISKPMQSANGTPINPAPPRTGMPSAAIGKASPRTSATCSRAPRSSPTPPIHGRDGRRLPRLHRLGHPQGHGGDHDGVSGGAGLRDLSRSTAATWT
jgi:hypothetical protein